MKKLFFLSACAVAAMLSSCGKGSPSASLKTNIDTISYELGVALSPSDEELKAYLTQMGSDSAYTEEFIKGLRDGVSVGDDKAKAAYYQGLQAGMNIKMQTIAGVEHQLFGENDSVSKLNVKNIIAGLMDTRKGRTKLKINGAPATREAAGKDLQGRIEVEQKKVYEKKYAEAKKQNEEFMAKIAKTPGVQSAGNGVYYKPIKTGSGALPKDTNTVEVRYVGKLITGQTFDSSEQQTRLMPLSQMIKGFSTALVKMPVGSKWEIYIPYNLGYGELGQGPIAPYSSLIFEVELVSIK